VLTEQPSVVSEARAKQNGSTHEAGASHDPNGAVRGHRCLTCLAAGSDATSAEALRALHVVNVYLAMNMRRAIAPATILAITGGLANIARQLEAIAVEEAERRGIQVRRRLGWRKAGR
jgi:hypothetical protein